MVSLYILLLVVLLDTTFFCAVEGECLRNITGDTYVIVEVEQGTLRGQEKTSEYFPDKKYYSFEHIPYAKPPVGPLRFKDPEEPEPWSGVRGPIRREDSCTQDPHPGTSLLEKCAKHNTKSVDDCLYLDVDTPQIGGSGLPVVVRIHPAAFGIESSCTTEHFGPGHYMVENVVLVSLRYRHGVLGFLCLEHEEVPGNAGLKDQVMALKWVQRNIANFSGDPNSVTLIGIAIGGAYIHYHLLSPLSRELFHRVIIQSGSALSPYMCIPRDTAVKRAFSLGKVLGCNIRNKSELLECLREVDVAKLSPAAAKLLDNEENVLNFGVPFAPCVEMPANNKSFLLLPPRTLLKEGQFAKVPTVFGVTNMEGMVSHLVDQLPLEEGLEKQNKEVEKCLPRNMGLQEGSIEYKRVVREIKRFYFGNKPLFQQMNTNYVKLFCDVFYNLAFDEAVQLQVENTQEPVYVFQFNLFNLKTPLNPFFNGRSCRKGKYDAVYDMITKMWTTFAKTSDPNFEGMKTKWEPARKDNFSHVVIEVSITPVKGRVAEERMQMWQQLYERYPHMY